MAELHVPMLSYAELKAKVEALQIKAPAVKKSELRFKIAQKGGVSVYGLGNRLPVTLYYEQWIALLEQEKGLRNFLEANKDSLKKAAASN